MSTSAPPRLFVAVFPDAAAAARLAELPRPAEPGVRWVPSENLHVTLRFLGRAPFDSVAEALAAVHGAATVARSAGPVGRLGRDAIVVPIAGLDELAAQVAAATALLGQPAAGFRGHLTLARLRQRAACGLSSQAVDLSWPVDEFALVESELRHDGAVHRVVRRYRLVGTES